MKPSKLWSEYKDKRVRLLIKDGLFTRPRDGIFKDIDDSHIFLEITENELPKPFLRSDVKRVEVKESE